MRVALVIVLAGCYAPTPQAGAPCAGDECPSGLVCSPVTHTCELPGGDASVVVDTSDAPPDVPPDAAFAVNDPPSGAIDVTGGGTFTVDLGLSLDDAPELGCGGDGGRDVFYKVVLSAPEVYYFDTFGSSVGTVLRVYPGRSCMAFGNGMPACNTGACGGAQSQYARSLPAGTSCIIIDQHANDPGGMVTLTVARGGRDGTRINSGTQTFTGSSCSGINGAQASMTCAVNDAGTAEDVGYFFTACPGQTATLDASTCVDPTMVNFDTVVYAGTLDGTQLACVDDTSTCAARPTRPDHADGSVISAQAVGPGLFWLTVDGYAGACGMYRLDTNLH